MAEFIIPVTETTDPFHEQVELDGLFYELSFRWNPRGSHWSMDVGRDGTVVVYGIKLVVIDDLLAQYRRAENLPIGKLFIEDLDGLDTDPDDTNFGDRVVLRYTESV